MLVFIIYLIGIVEPLTVSLVVLFVVFLAAKFLSFLCVLDNSISKSALECWSGVREAISTKWLALPLILAILIPSEDTAYKMLAVYGVTEVVSAANESEDVKRIASKSLALIEKTIDDNLEN